MPNPNLHYRLASRERQAEMNVLPIEKQVQIVSALVEGNSIRSTARMVGVEHKTVMRVLLRVGKKCQRLDSLSPSARAKKSWNNCGRFGTSLEQNPQFRGRFSAVCTGKGNRIIKEYGAGDGNRTHVRSLGSLRSKLTVVHLWLLRFVEEWSESSDSVWRLAVSVLV